MLRLVPRRARAAPARAQARADAALGLVERERAWHARAERQAGREGYLRGLRTAREAVHAAELELAKRISALRLEGRADEVLVLRGQLAGVRLAREALGAGLEVERDTGDPINRVPARRARGALQPPAVMGVTKEKYPPRTSPIARNEIAASPGN